MEITCQLLNADSEVEISQWRELYRVCFHDKAGRSFWDWIHQENPFYTNTRPLVCIAKTGSRIIGAVSLVPSPLQEISGTNHRVIRSCLVCKAMVHPDFQGTGIFSALLEHAKKTAGAEGYDLLVTFSTNPHSYRGFVRAGFSYVTEIVRSRYYLSTDRMVQKYCAVFPGIIATIQKSFISLIYSRLLPQIRHNFRTDYRDVMECAGEIERMYAAPRPGSGVYGIRTAPFIRWRFSFPQFQFKCLSLSDDKGIAAYAVIEYQDEGKTAEVVDISSRDQNPALLLTLVSELVSFLKKEQFDSIGTYHLNRDGCVSDIFTPRHGFIRRSRVPREKTPPRFLWYALKEGVCTQDPRAENQWYIQAADTCLFWAE